MSTPPERILPEPLSLLGKWSWISSVRRLVELREQSLAGFLTWVVGELHRNGLSGTGRLLSIQPFNGLFSLHTPIEADKTHTSRHAYMWKKNTGYKFGIIKKRLFILFNYPCDCIM